MFNFPPTDFGPFHKLFISLGLGLLVGLQREWVGSPLAGIRSFSLVCILGTLSGILSENFGFWAIALGFSAVLGMALVGQFSLMRNTLLSGHRGLVSELSIVLVYFIGVLVHTGPILLAASIAGLLAFVLQVKLELHSLAAKFSMEEIRSIMQFVLVLLVIFPIVPNQTFGTYHSINPHNIWLMVVLIVGISLVGHIIYKFFGRNAGVLLNGFLGGVISSTATTLSSSRSAKGRDSSAPYYGVIILMAWATLYPRVLLELWITTSGISSVTSSLIVLVLASIIPILWMWRKVKNGKGVGIENKPTELKMAFTFALMYGFVLLAISYAKAEFGSKGLAMVALISGVVDVDAITLSSGRHVSSGVLSPSEAHDVILAAILSNNFFKGMICLVVGGRKLFRWVLIPWLISLGVGGGLLYVKG